MTEGVVFKRRFGQLCRLLSTSGGCQTTIWAYLSFDGNHPVVLKAGNSRYPALNSTSGVIPSMRKGVFMDGTSFCIVPSIKTVIFMDGNGVLTVIPGLTRNLWTAIGIHVS